MNEKDSKNSIGKEGVFAIAVVGIATAATVGLLGYKAGYTSGYFKGAKAGADLFASYIGKEFPEAAEILIKAGAIVKK